jgi:hypothetical protein
MIACAPALIFRFLEGILEMRAPRGASRPCRPAKLDGAVCTIFYQNARKFEIIYFFAFADKSCDGHRHFTSNDGENVGIKVVRRLPPEQGGGTHTIKSPVELFERMVRESELAAMTPGKSLLSASGSRKT